VLGYEMRAVGQPRAARFAGIRSIAHADLDRAALRRLAGSPASREVAGLKGNLTLDLSPGFGYTGIVVAMLAMLHPLGVVAAAIFVAGIFVGADAMSRAVGVPSYIADVIVATSLLTMLVASCSDALPAAVAMSKWTERSTSCCTAVLLGRRPAHRHAADLRHAGRADLRARRRAQPRHRGHHGRRRLHRLARRLPGADLWTGVPSPRSTGAVFGLLHALLTVPLALSQHVSGIGITLLATSAHLLHLPRRACRR
jgi:ABC-type uncharacterized transport system permease subunit